MLAPLNAVLIARPVALEPGRHDEIERRPAHRRPPRPTQQHGRCELPKLSRIGPGNGAGCRKNGAAHGGRRGAEAAIDVRQYGDEQRTRQKMRGDRERDRGDRPAV